MKRPIKFRGRCIGNGTLVYGDLTHNFDDVYVNDWQVKPESVAHLVGYDANGNEVYEGDKLVDDNGCETPAMLFALQFSGKLKEATT